MKHKKAIKFIILVIILAILYWLFKEYDLYNRLSPGEIRKKIDSYGVLAPVFFIILYIVATMFFLPGAPLTVTGGIIFGSVMGTIYVVIGASIGATLAFLFSLFLGRSLIEDLVKRRFKKVFSYNQKLSEHGLKVMLFLRLIPLFPFNGLNFTLGLTRVKLRDYVIGTIFGIIPGSFVYAYFGDSIARASFINIIISLVLILSLIIVVSVYKRNGKQTG